MSVDNISRGKAWREANKESLRLKKAAKYQANKETAKEKQRQYYAAHSEDINKKRKKDGPHEKRGPKPKAEKVCPMCKVLKPRSEFYKKLTTMSGYCKTCSDIKTNEFRQANPQTWGDYGNKSRRERYATDEDYRNKISDSKTERYAANKDEILEVRRERYATDRGYRAACLARNRRTQQAQPKWADVNAIREVYKTCPEGCHVDHVIPLRGRIDGRRVSGLHIAENLQHLTAGENLRKHCIVSEADI